MRAGNKSENKKDRCGSLLIPLFKYLLGSKTVMTKLTSKSLKKKTKNLLRETLFRNRFFFTKSFAEEMRVIGQELEKDRYAATEHVLCSVAT